MCIFDPPPEANILICLYLYIMYIMKLEYKEYLIACVFPHVCYTTVVHIVHLLCKLITSDFRLARVDLCCHQGRSQEFSKPGRVGAKEKKSLTMILAYVVE